MVVALSERAYTLLKRAFKQRTVEKRYHALVQGHPDPSSGTIDAPIGRHRGHDWKFAVTEDGRHSVTHYDTVEAFVAASLLDVHLETGRTHQIRVHFAALHHPCCGDLTYGADPTLAKKLGLERQWLHARSLAFAHPGRRPADRDHQPVPAPTCSTRSTCCATTNCERRAAAFRAAVRCGRLRLVGAVPGVLPVAAARRPLRRSSRTASCGARSSCSSARRRARGSVTCAGSARAPGCCCWRRRH